MSGHLMNGNTGGAGASILIVDIPANLNLLSDALEPAGYNILAAPSGEGGRRDCPAERSRI